MIKQPVRTAILICAVTMIVALSTAFRCIELFMAQDIFGGVCWALIACIAGVVCVFGYLAYREMGAEIKKQNPDQD